MNQTTSSNLFVRIWCFFWNIISWIRISVLNILFLIVLFIVISAIVSAIPKPIDTKGPLLLAPSGQLVDQLSYQAPLSLLSQQEKAPETLLRDLIDTINHAALDERVTALILKLDDLNGGGISKMQELGQAIDYFKLQNKPVFVFSNNFNQQQYFLATYANDIYMHDMGSVAITGFALYRNYFKGLIDKLGVNVHVFKSGTFKDFVEPYIREDMSEASRNHNTEWITSLWQGYSEHIEIRRQLDKGSLDNAIKNYSQLLIDNQGDTALFALNFHLVDKIGSKQNLIDDFKARFGASKDPKKPFNFIDASSYQQELAIAKLQQPKGNIGLIVAAGNISDGEQPEGSIGGDSLSYLIRKARNDQDLKALVIRVDSGGGSAFASELIRQEIAETRNSGKPVYISMGSMTASGGYWLATGADQIWATPTTLTGSIGVFSIVPTVENTLTKVGITSDGLATSELAGIYQLDRPMSATAEQIFQLSVESIYQKFLQLCATARKTDIENIKKVAEGRVWLGHKALDLNLVDHLGSLNDVIAAIAKDAGIATPSIVLIERELSTTEQIVKNLMQTTQAYTGNIFKHSAGATTQWLKQLDAELDKNPLVALIQDQLATPQQQKVYAACPDCTIH